MTHVNTENVNRDNTQSAREPAAATRRHAVDRETVLRRAGRVLAPTYKRPEMVLVHGEGARLFDARGRVYLDMTSGIGVTALGHGAPDVTRALQEAAGGLVHVSNLFHTAPAVELAEELVRRSFADRVFFANSGAEAVEGAIKFARLQHGAQRRSIVTFSGSFHGRTLGTLAATDRPAYRAPFSPLPGGFSQLAWNDEEALADIGPDTAAALVEPIQGEGGVRVPDRSWLQALRRRCDDTGALLIFDEVQSGLGRVGRLWAHELFDVTPDMMTLAKPLAGGLPMGAVLMTERVSRPITAGCHATTFGGGPLVSQVALRTLRAICWPGFLAGVRRKGRQLQTRLRKIRSPLIRQVRGEGLFVGLQLQVPPARVVEAARELGLLVVPAGEDVIRFLPPLTVTDMDLRQAAQLTEEALDRVAREGV